MSSDMIRITQAFDYACRKHAPQRRKASHGEPYVNHLAEVGAPGRPRPPAATTPTYHRRAAARRRRGPGVKREEWPRISASLWPPS